MVREGGHLVPRDPYSYDVVVSLTPGRDVFVDVRQARNPKQHKLLFALLHKVAQNDPKGRTVEVLLQDLKIAAGMVRPVIKTIRGPRGQPRVETFLVVQSIAFASMSQADFKPVLEKFLQLLADDVLGGACPNRLLAEVAESMR